MNETRSAAEARTKLSSSLETFFNVVWVRINFILALYHIFRIFVRPSNDKLTGSKSEAAIQCNALGRLYDLINNDGTNKYHQNKTQDKYAVSYSFHAIHSAGTTRTK